MRPKKPRNNCKYCDKEVYRLSGIYCNTRCQLAFQRKIRIELWLEGTIDGVSMIQSIKKYYLIPLYGIGCWKCGWKEINLASGTVPVEMNHIDGDWRNCRSENLEILCPNCHSLTSTFRALNRRKADRKKKGQRKIF